jgi:hypothetical protein
VEFPGVSSFFESVKETAQRNWKKRVEETSFFNPNEA